MCRVIVPNNGHQLMTTGEGRAKSQAKSRSAQAMIQLIGQNYGNNTNMSLAVTPPMAINNLDPRQNRHLHKPSPVRAIEFRPHNRDSSHGSPERLPTLGIGCIAPVVDPLTNGLADITANIHSMRQQNENLTAKNTYLTEQLQSANDNKHILSYNLVTKDQEIAKLTDEMQTLKQFNEQLDQNVKEYKKLVDKCQTDLNQKADQMAKCKDKWLNARKRVDHLQRKYEDTAHELAAKTFSLIGTNNQIKYLNERIKSWRDYGDNYRLELSDEKTKNNDLVQQLAVNETKLKAVVNENEKQKAKCMSIKKKADKMANKLSANEHKLKTNYTGKLCMAKEIQTLKGELWAAKKQNNLFKAWSLRSKEKEFKSTYKMTKVGQQCRQNPHQLAASVGQSTHKNVNQFREQINEMVNQFETQMMDSIDSNAEDIVRKNAAVERLAEENADKITANLSENKFHCPECPKTYSGTNYLSKHIADKHMNAPMDVTGDEH